MESSKSFIKEGKRGKKDPSTREGFRHANFSNYPDIRSIFEKLRVSKEKEKIFSLYLDYNSCDVTR